MTTRLIVQTRRHICRSALATPAIIRARALMPLIGIIQDEFRFRVAAYNGSGRLDSVAWPIDVAEAKETIKYLAFAGCQIRVEIVQDASCFPPLKIGHVWGLGMRHYFKGSRVIFPRGGTPALPPINLTEA